MFLSIDDCDCELPSDETLSNATATEDPVQFQATALARRSGWVSLLPVVGPEIRHFFRILERFQDRNFKLTADVKRVELSRRSFDLVLDQVIAVEGAGPQGGIDFQLEEGSGANEELDLEKCSSPSRFLGLFSSQL